MLDPKEQARFNKNCADAAKGYAEAAGQAYADMAQKSLEMWTSSFAALLGAGVPGKPEPKSWYRKPLDGEIFPPSQAAFPFAQEKSEPAWPFSQWMALNPFFANNPFASAIPFMRPATAGSAPVFGPFAAMSGFGAEQASPFDPGQLMSAHFKAMANPFWPMMAWWTFAQSGLSPKAWPMAFGMIASGVPQKVAWPTAAANAAAQEAAQTATRSIDAAFARYHTSTGHASAQIVHAGPFMIAIAIAPIGAAALMPWLSLPPAGT